MYDQKLVANDAYVSYVLFLFYKASLMRINVKILGEGPGPAERVVSLRTRGGESEEVVLSQHDLVGERIDVGAPLAFEGSNYLVELPREASSGRWRVWIPENDTDKNLFTQAAE